MAEILVLQAIAAGVRGDTDQAMETLVRALSLAEPKDFIRTFVDEGMAMAHLLYEALSQGLSPVYVRRLLAAFPNVELEQPTVAPQVLVEEWIEPLSERDLDVLQLIAEGLSNQKIASQLYLSLNTVKAHTRSIYGKLGVNNRTQAGARGRALGILSDS